MKSELENIHIKGNQLLNSAVITILNKFAVPAITIKEPYNQDIVNHLLAMNNIIFHEDITGNRWITQNGDKIGPDFRLEYTQKQIKKDGQYYTVQDVKLIYCE